MPRYVVFPSLQISVFSRNTGKYGPEKTPYLDSFHSASFSQSHFETLKCLFLSCNNLRFLKKIYRPEVALFSQYIFFHIY